MWELESDQRFLSYGFGNGDSSKDGKDRSLGIGLAFTLGDEAALTLMFDRYEAFQTDFEFLNAGIRLGF
jgi:hypothetical protein